MTWIQINEMAKAGVTIGSHTSSHLHMPTATEKTNIEELERSQKSLAKALGIKSNIFAYPYGETSLNIKALVKKSGFLAAFGQHSGVINDTSNLYYLPRFSLNEKYGEIDRVKFTANTKGLGVYDFIPSNPHIFDNPPFIGFSLLDKSLISSLDCFIFDNNGKVDSEVYKFNERIEIRLKRKLSKGRSRLNCTAKDQLNNWRWFGHQFYL